MHDRRAWSFLIPAAGDGTRLGLGPKAGLLLAGRTLVDWAIERAADIADEIVVAAPADAIASLSEAWPRCTVIAGGSTRQDTVKALLDRSGGSWVMIHDVARPFASAELMLAVAREAASTGAAAALGPLDVPVATVVDGMVAGYTSPRNAGLFQSPLAFRRDVLAAAYAKAGDRQAQSTLELVVDAGFAVRAVPGERANIKITTAEDLALAGLLAGRLLPERWKA